jgi:hypothetical protein
VSLSCNRLPCTDMSPTGWGCGRMPERQHQRCGVRCDAAAANDSSQGGSSRPAVSVGNGDCWQRACPWVPVVPTAAQKIWPISRRLLEDVEPPKPKACPCAVPASGHRPSFLLQRLPSSAPEPTCSRRHRTAASLHRRCPNQSTAARPPAIAFFLTPASASPATLPSATASIPARSSVRVLLPRPCAPTLRLGPRSSIPAIPAPLANPTSKSATDPSPPPSQCPSLPTTPMRYLPSTAKS